MPHATHPSPGLQALVLCGPGVSLNTFTSTPEDFPKALVPIANRPMVWYAIDLCHRMGITDMTLITPPEAAAALESAFKINPALTSLPSPKPEILSPEDLTLTTGTAEILRSKRVQDRITSDFVVLPCDLISELEGSRVIEQWLSLNPFTPASNSPSLKGGLAIYYPTQGLEGISTKKDETDFMATAPLPKPSVRAPAGSLRSNVECLLLNMPTDTLKDTLDESQDKSLSFRQALLTKNGRVKIKTKHRDAHIYVFPKWVKQFAAANEKFDSISEDLVGWWAKSGWQDGLSTKLGLDEILSPITTAELDESQSLEEDVDLYALSTTRATSAKQNTTSFASRTGLPAQLSKQWSGTPPMHVYVQPSLPTLVVDPTKPATIPDTLSQPLIRRIDTSLALLNVSLYLAKQSLPHPLAYEHKIHPTAQIGQQARISESDSLVAENVKIGMRVNIKESIIGANCDIGPNARLTRCLVMDNVTIGDGVQLTGCIVGRRAKIEGAEAHAAGDPAVPAPSTGKGKGKKKKGDDDDDKTRLTDCEVAPGYVVEAGTQSKGEKMMAFDADEDLDEEMDEDDDLDDEE